MLIGQFIRLLRVRFGLILAVTLVVIATTIVISILTPKRYVSTTSMVVDLPSNDPVLGSAVFLQGTVSGFLATQVDIIRSERVVQRVIDRLELDKNPTVVDLWSQSGGKGTARSWVTGELIKGLAIEPSREGAVLNLSVEFRDAQLSADIANAFAQAYGAITLEMKTEPARNYAATFEEQSRRYREELRTAQERLSQFQQRAGITSSDERYDVENTRLQELSTELVRVQAASVDSRSRAEAVQRNGRDVLPEAVANPMVGTLRAELGRAEARLEEQSARFGLAHPTILATQAEVNGLRSRLDAEMSRVATSIGTGNSINQQREGQLRAVVEAQRTRVLALKKQRDELAQLQRDVDAAQRNVELLQTRVTQTTLESRARQSNVSIVTAAFPPDKPSRPQPILNTVVGAFVGLLLGVLAAITLENFNRPLRDSDDLIEAVGLPVLAVLPPASSRRPQRLIGSTGPAVAPTPRLTKD
jgi:chain length determinant protein EpsF